MTLNLKIRISSACRASLDEVSLFLLDQLTAMGIWSQVSGTAGWAAKKGKAAACSTGAAVSWIAAPALIKVKKNSRDTAVVTTGTVAANALFLPWVALGSQLLGLQRDLSLLGGCPCTVGQYQLVRFDQQEITSASKD